MPLASPYPLIPLRYACLVVQLAFFFQLCSSDCPSLLILFYSFMCHCFNHFYYEYLFIFSFFVISLIFMIVSMGCPMMESLIVLTIEQFDGFYSSLAFTNDHLLLRLHNLRECQCNLSFEFIVVCGLQRLLMNLIYWLRIMRSEGFHQPRYVLWTYCLDQVKFSPQFKLA